MADQHSSALEQLLEVSKTLALICRRVGQRSSMGEFIAFAAIRNTGRYSAFSRCAKGKHSPHRSLNCRT